MPSAPSAPAPPGVAVVGDGLEGDLDSRSGGERAGRENRAAFIVSVFVAAADVHGAVGEAQRAVPDFRAVGFVTTGSGICAEMLPGAVLDPR